MPSAVHAGPLRRPRSARDASLPCGDSKEEFILINKYLRLCVGNDANAHKIALFYTPRRIDVLGMAAVPGRQCSRREYLIPSGTDIESFRRGRFGDMLRMMRYTCTRASHKTLVFEGLRADRKLRVVRCIVLDERRPLCSIGYAVHNETSRLIKGQFCGELHVGLKDFRFNKTDDIPGIREITFKDNEKDVVCVIRPHRMMGVWHFPVETRLYRAGELRRAYQGICLGIYWPVCIKAGESWHGTITITVHTASEHHA